MPLSRHTRRAALAMVLATAVAGPASANNRLTGTYMVQGRNADGSSYEGTVRLTQTGSTVNLAWRVGDQSYRGTGRFDGAVLVVDWGDSYPVVYVLMSDGSLHGTWANGYALERLSR
ncbi:MAG: hypothetical protein NXH82_10820 [Rhodobacteraceae bacterium]|nr:hypothetical protein [Paracoccaceae bacterium]